jgi:outer membrane protein assembly factor BamB
VILGSTRALANYDGYELVLCDLGDGGPVMPTGTIETVTIAPASEGASFALSTDEGVAQDYSAATGTPIGSQFNLGPIANVGALPIALTGSGSVIIADDSGELSALDVADGDLLGEQAAGALGVADDGAWLATTDGGSLATFSCPVCGDAGGLLSDARSLIPAELTASERAKYLDGQQPEFTP